MGDTPLLPDIERILDEESAFIARPSKAVSVRIALAAYIAAQKKIDRDLSEVFARIEATMCDTHKMCDDGPVSSREGRISERDFDALTAVFTEAPLRSLAAVRAPGDEEVANALAHLETIRSGANFAQAFSADALSALITRLTARLSSAERERDEARENFNRLLNTPSVWAANARQWELQHPGKKYADLHWHWWGGANGNPPKVEGEGYRECTEAIIAALLQEGIGAWNGDATSIVTQIVEAQYKARVAAESALAVALVERDRAREAALEEAAKVCETLTGSDTTPTLRPGARMCLHRIRSLAALQE